MNTKNIIRYGLTAILLLPGFHSPLLTQHIGYRVVPIPAQLSYGRLNDNDVVAGTSWSGTAWTWNKGFITYLPGLGGANRWARDINNNGVVVGAVSDSKGWTYACAWHNGMLSTFDAPDYLASWASSINSGGTVVGRVADTASAWQEYPFIFTGSVTTLNNLENYQFNDINNAGVIAGTSWSSRNKESGRAFTYEGGTVTFMSAPGIHAESFAVNNSNHVVSEFNHLDFYLWKNGTQVFLESFTNFGGLNDYDAVVGHSSSLGAIIWEDGRVRQLDTLIDTGLGLHLSNACDINNKGRILCMGSDHFAYLLIPVATIAQPLKDDIWISGEQDTIKWDYPAHGVDLILDFSTDGGSSWMMIASGISGDTGKYAWDIPDGILSTKCLVRIKDYFSGDTLGVSDTFKIKPYILTRINSTTGDFIAYDIAKDKWGFANEQTDVWPSTWYQRFDYQGIDPFTLIQYPQIQSDEFTAFSGAESKNFPDWVSWVRAFSVGACYVNPASAIYKQLAIERWEGAKDAAWDGSCFGIAGTNALAFRFRDQFFNKFPRFPNFSDPISVLSDTNVIPVVSEVFTHQYGNPSLQNDDACYGIKTPTQTLAELRAMLRGDTSAIRTLTLYDARPVNNEGAHTILAYKLERVSNSSPLWNVFVYDNSEPDDTTARVVIDTSANGGNGSWSYSHLPGWGGPFDLYLEVLSENYLGDARLSKASLRRSPFALSPGRLQVDITPRTSVRIMDDAANIAGFRNDQLLRDIPGSRPLVVKNPGQGPPYGYMMAMNNYTVTLDSFATSESRAFFFAGNTAFGYKRSDAASSQTDKLRFDTTNSPSLSAANPDAQSKSITLKNIIDEPAGEKVYLIQALGLSQNDSVAIQNVDTDRLKLVSHGPAKNYDLTLEHASTTQLRVFGKTNIFLASNTTHIIAPQWDALRDSLLTILIDAGNDGTIDDTVALQNELTGVDDRGSLIPDEYRLHQNYPNPFNPTTTIRFDVPEASFVSLKVYDVLGLEVATLVDGKREAGNHEVEFDGSDLTSGVYFYRLRAGVHSEIKKLLLLR